MRADSFGPVPAASNEWCEREWHCRARKGLKLLLCCEPAHGWTSHACSTTLLPLEPQGLPRNVPDLHWGGSAGRPRFDSINDPRVHWTASATWDLKDGRSSRPVEYVAPSPPDAGPETMPMAGKATWAPQPGLPIDYRRSLPHERDCWLDPYKTYPPAAQPLDEVDQSAGPRSVAPHGSATSPLGAPRKVGSLELERQGRSAGLCARPLGLDIGLRTVIKGKLSYR